MVLTNLESRSKFVFDQVIKQYHMNSTWFEYTKIHANSHDVSPYLYVSDIQKSVAVLRIYGVDFKLI